LKNVIAPQTAGKILLACLILLAIFHALVISGLLPGDIVWSGQVRESRFEIVLMESVSLIITLLFAIIVSIQLGIICQGKLRKTVRFGLWVMFLFFTLGIIGNIASPSRVENYIFTPLAIIMAFLSLRLAIDK